MPLQPLFPVNTFFIIVAINSNCYYYPSIIYWVLLNSKIIFIFYQIWKSGAVYRYFNISLEANTTFLLDKIVVINCYYWITCFYSAWKVCFFERERGILCYSYDGSDVYHSFCICYNQRFFFSTTHHIKLG